MPYEVQVKQVPAQHVAAIRKHTSMDTIGQDVGQAFAELWGAIAPAGITPVGPPFLMMSEALSDGTEGDIELCVPVPQPFEGSGPVVGHDVEAVTAVATMYRGPYDGVGVAYETLVGWVRETGHQISGPPREVYLTDPLETPDPADYLTEVLFPIG